MESTMKHSVRHFGSGPAQHELGLFAELDGSPRTLVKAVMTGIAVMTIGVLMAWAVAELWSSSMTQQESANAMLVRDQLFGDLIGAADVGNVPALVAPDAQLMVPGGTLVGPDGLRALVEEMNRVESTTSLILLDVAAQGDAVLATWTIDEPHASTLLGFESAAIDGNHVSGQMLLRIVDQQIVWLDLTTWKS